MEYAGASGGVAPEPVQSRNAPPDRRFTPIERTKDGEKMGCLFGCRSGWR
nr:MAG TPA: hypothetical protein [Caudoviricetes sp.]